VEKMGNNIQAPRGTYDVLPDQSAKWQEIEAKIIELCNLYQYKEIRTPIFEHTELFQAASVIRRIS